MIMLGSLLDMIVWKANVRYAEKDDNENLEHDANKQNSTPQLLYSSHAYLMNIQMRVFFEMKINRDSLIGKVTACVS